MAVKSSAEVQDQVADLCCGFRILRSISPVFAVQADFWTYFTGYQRVVVRNEGTCF